MGEESIVRYEEIFVQPVLSFLGRHNLSFYIWLVSEAREKIIDGSFYDWKKKMVKQLSQKL